MSLSRNEQIQIYRSLFVGRQDVYGKKWEVVKDLDEIKSGYAPVCENFWSSGCHIKNKTGKGCDSCEIKKYAPVSDKSVLKHIEGAEQHIYYVLHQDGNIRFAACDFDLKPGKEEKGYGWDEVTKFLDVIDAWGIPYTVARSTTAGFHVYFFTEELYAANKFRAIIYEAYERCGFMEYLRLGLKTIPEVFPKQSYNSADGIGNGIKTPMIETSFWRERNGLVTRNNEWIGAGLGEQEMVAAQWDALKNAVRIPSASLDALIAQEEIIVHEESTFGSGGSARRGTGRVGTGKTRWQPAITGSMEKLVEGCGAFRRIRDECNDGKTVGHQQGFALYHAAMNTVDGIEWFEKSVPGWGKTGVDMKQLDHSQKKNYSPWTCRTMQEQGICVPGTKCFKPKLQVDIVEGKEVPRTDLPHLEPSPMRYAYGKGEDFLVKLMREVDQLMLESDPAVQLQSLREIVTRGQVFDKSQQAELKAHIKAKKVVGARELTKLFTQAAHETTEAIKERVASTDGYTKVGNYTYGKMKDYGYFIEKTLKLGEKTLIIISDCDIAIDEIRHYTDGDGDAEDGKTVLVGKLRYYNVEKSFEIPTSKWCDNTEFIKFFNALSPENFNPLRADIEHIRQAAMGFSKLEGLKRTNCMTSSGYNNTFTAYLMPSVIVTKEGVIPNTEQHIDLRGKEYANFLDFSILAEDEFKDTLLHIKTDMLNAWPRMWSTVAVSHALLPVVLRHLGESAKPTLFMEGATGAGKTELTHMMQYFWGDFPKLLNMLSSAKGLMSVGYDFKDALLVVDDFKGLTKSQIQTVESVIQYGYGGSMSIQLQRDSSQNKSKGSRAVMVISGEYMVGADAAQVARCIVVETEKQDTTSTRDLYLKCMKNCHRYNGVTARFIQWYLNQDKTKTEDWFKRFRDMLHHRIKDKINSERTAYNLGMNHLVWNLFVEFMFYHEVITHDEKVNLAAEHYNYVLELTGSSVSRGEEEENAEVFFRILHQLLDSGEVGIRGLRGYDSDKHHRKYVGCAPLRTDPARPNLVYLYPEVTWQTVKTFSRDTNIRGSVRSLGKILKANGILVDFETGKCTKQLSSEHHSGRKRVWVVDLDRAGIAEDLPLGKGHPGTLLEFRPSVGEQSLEGIM